MKIVLKKQNAVNALRAMQRERLGDALPAREPAVSGGWVKT